MPPQAPQCDTCGKLVLPVTRSKEFRNALRHRLSLVILHATTSTRRAPRAWPLCGKSRRRSSEVKACLRTIRHPRIASRPGFVIQSLGSTVNANLMFPGTIAPGRTGTRNASRSPSGARRKIEVWWNAGPGTKTFTSTIAATRIWTFKDFTSIAIGMLASRVQRANLHKTITLAGRYLIVLQPAWRRALMRRQGR